MNTLPGTLTPEQMQMQQAIIEALRQPQVMQQAAPMMQSNRVVPVTSGLNSAMPLMKPAAASQQLSGADAQIFG